MAFKTVVFVSLLVAAVALVVQSQIIPLLLNLIRIEGTLFCTVNGNVGPGGPSATPVFPNATIQLQCGSGNNVIQTVTTNGQGVFEILLSPINFLLDSTLSGCRLVVTTPLANCDVNLSPSGVLVSALRFIGNTVEGVLTIANLGPLGFILRL